MKGYYINERYIAYDKQQRFTIPKPYVEGGITVHLNGSHVSNGKDLDYVEVDNYTISFNAPLNEGDIVVIESLYNNPKVSIDVIGNNNYNPNTIFKKYGSIEKLKFNSKYNMCIKIKDDYVNWSFYSKLNPMLTTINKIRLDTGDLLENVPDVTIMKVIYLNSKEAVDLYESLEDDSTSDSTSTSYPKILNTWTRYRTDMDLIHAVYLTISGKYGTAAKKVGVIDISQTIKLPYINEMLSRFKQKFEQANEALKPNSNAPQKFVRAGNTDYPVNERMSF